MKLTHLNFAQLHRLASPANLLRVTTAYHKALHRLWDSEDGGGSIEFFTVGLAEAYFPEFCKPWQRVLLFLRSDALKTALRKAADDFAIQCTPEPWTPVCVLEARRFPTQVRTVLSGLVYRLCRNNNLAARIQTHELSEDVRVVADCNAHGPTVLLYQSGIAWGVICETLRAYNLAPFEVFPWLVLADLRPTTRVNPLQWPVNTPDFYEHGKTLAYND